MVRVRFGARLDVANGCVCFFLNLTIFILDYARSLSAYLDKVRLNIASSSFPYCIV